MSRSEPTNLGAELAAALAKLEHVLVDPEVAEEHARQVREFELTETRRRRRERLESVEVELPYLAHKAVVDDAGLANGTSLEAVRRWLPRRDLPAMLVLSGTHGCGKTVACAWAVASTADSVAWSNALDLERTFAASFGPDATEQQRIRKARLTVLDDLGTEKDPAKMATTLFEIIESRKQRKTLVTTNMSKEKWLARYADVRLHSRYKESLIFVSDRGPDMRGAK